MAFIAPSDLPPLATEQEFSPEVVTLNLLRRTLPRDYIIFHTIHWSNEWKPVPAFGEADFIIVNGSGKALVIEQKNGRLQETDGRLVKKYPDQRKDVVLQVHRTLEGIQAKFKRLNGGIRIDLDYLIYCPDHQILDLNAAGLDASRVVDASAAAKLCTRIEAILPATQESATGDRVRQFFEQTFALVPDIHAYVTAGERTFTRLSGGLASVIGSIEMKPMRLRISGTAGCGKSTVASSQMRKAAEDRRRSLLLCFNRPLAERFRSSAPEGATVDTWYGFIAKFLQDRGQEIDFTRMQSEPAFWTDLQERVLGEEVPDKWRFDSIVVDEGQDFEPDWAELLKLFCNDEYDLLWLEDPDQRIRASPPVSPGENGFVGFRARTNFRSPVSIARFLQATLPFEFEIGSTLPGLGVGVASYKDDEHQAKLAGKLVSDLMKMGFKAGEIVILSVRGMASASLSASSRLGNFTLSRFTGAYDLFGNQIFEKGQVRFDTAYRFKGQQAPAVIVMDVDPDPARLDHSRRVLFSALTRATVRLELLVRAGNPLVEPFLDQR